MSVEMLAVLDGRAGRLRLNRPKAIHALTEGMCRTMIDALVAWRADPAVELVLIDHAPPPDGDVRLSRGFCAGGDVRAAADSGRGPGVWVAVPHEKGRSLRCASLRDQDDVLALAREPNGRGRGVIGAPGDHRQGALREPGQGRSA